MRRTMMDDPLVGTTRRRRTETTDKGALFTHTEIAKDDVQDILDVVRAGDAREGASGGF